MSIGVLAQARPASINRAARDAANKASQLNSQLNAMCDEVLAFAAFMHTDPRSEFTQEDRDVYSAEFATQFANIQATLSKLAPLAGIEEGSVTVADFLASYQGDVTAYSARFDKG